MALDSLLPGKKSHAEKAKELKIRTIHIAEIDTQTEFEKDKSKWRNTWSINGFYEEGTAPPELGMGSHESIPKDAEKVRLKKTKALILPGIGWKTIVRSSLPGRPYEGYLVQHAEALSINNYLSTDRYSPSVYYVYRPCPASIESIEHFGVKRDPRPAEQKMLYHSNSEGEDRLGVLLLGPGISRYYGSYCSSTESRLIFEQYQYAGPTSSQVVAGILSALWLILRKPRLGIMEPDDIPPKYTREMLKFVKPLLGEIVDEEIAWRPKEFDLRHLLVRRK
jgi:homospermidine synthase